MHHLSDILEDLFSSWDKQEKEHPISFAIKSLRESIIHNTALTAPSVYAIRMGGMLEDDVRDFEKYINSICPSGIYREAISYFISELVCNVEQHASVSAGYGLAYFNPLDNRLFIGICDGGLTVYGSYVKSQKYVGEIGDSEVMAVYKAQNGYSTKNRPDAENRGYGISTNSSMVVDGLGGAFAILSGNAMFYRDIGGKRIVELPEDSIWPGTIVIAEIPMNEHDFNIYDYIS